MWPKPNGSHALILDSACCYDEFGSVKANRRWRLEPDGDIIWPGSIDEKDKSLEPDTPEEINVPMDLVKEPSVGPLTKEWFDALPSDYKNYFLSRFKHLDEYDHKAILRAIWVTKEWNLSGLPVDSISALCDLINIVSLSISSTKCASLRPIMTLKRLASLYLSNTPIDTLRLPNERQSLKRLNISRTKIKDLLIIKVSPKSYDSISKLSNLNRYSAKNSNFSSLSSIHNSRDSIEVLELCNSNLSSIATMHHFQNLKYLDISGTSVTSLDKIGHAVRLKPWSSRA